MKTYAAALSALSLLLLSGCGKEEPQYVEVQEVKETPVVEKATVPETAQPHDHSSHAGLFHSEKPASWDNKENSPMVLMSFRAGSGASYAEIAVSAFPGDVGGQLANINRWRGQVGLEPVTPEATDGLVKELQVSGLPAWQVAFTGPLSASKVGEPVKMVVTAVFYDGKTWFFKMVGMESAVQAEQANYDAFLSSVKF